MNKFVSVPTEITAYIPSGSNDIPMELSNYIRHTPSTNGYTTEVKGMQGWVKVNPGDVLIREPNPKDGWYPCAADVFAKKYQPAGQHSGLPVAGYKSQSSGNIAIVNINKEYEEMVLRRLDYLKEMEGIDQRWLAIGRTSLEQAFMAINRAVFRPERAKLPGDEDNG